MSSDSASHLTTTATLLLRCAIETDDDTTAESCMSSVKVLNERLCLAKKEYNWELGDSCVARCETLIPRVIDANGCRRRNVTNQTAATVETFVDVQTRLHDGQPDAGMNISSPERALWEPANYDAEFPQLWDTLQFDVGDFWSS